MTLGLPDRMGACDGVSDRKQHEGTHCPPPGEYVRHSPH